MLGVKNNDKIIGISLNKTDKNKEEVRWLAAMTKFLGEIIEDNPKTNNIKNQFKVQYKKTITQNGSVPNVVL